jgi:hypothetical protein
MEDESEDVKTARSDEEKPETADDTNNEMLATFEHLNHKSGTT